MDFISLSFLMWERHYLGQDSSSKYRNLVALATIPVCPNILKSLKTKTLKSEKTKTLQYFCCLLANQVETW